MNQQPRSDGASSTLQVSFDQLIRTWDVRFRLRRLSNWSVRGVIFGLSIWTGFSAVASYSGLLIQSEFIRYLLYCVAASAITASLLALIIPNPEVKLARDIDRIFTLQNRISTAVEIKNLPELIQGDGKIYQQQQADALKAGLSVKPALGFFVHVSRLQLMLVTILVLANLSMIYVARDWFTRAASQRQVQEEIDTQIAAVEDLLTQVEANQEIPPEQKEKITQALEKAQQELAGAENREEAIAILTSTESELRSLDSQAARDQADALQQAGTQLQQSNEPGEPDPLSQFAESLSQGDFITAATQLDSLDLSDLTIEDRQALADQLNQLADSLAETNPSLSEQLQQAADALEQGDTQAAQQALQEAAQQLSQTGQQVAAAQAAEQAAAQLNQSGQQLAQGGQSAQASQPGQGTAPGSSPGSQSASGSSSQPGGQQPGSGAGQGESAGSDTTGQEVGDNPIGSENSPGDGGEKPYEQIFAPTRLGPGAGDTVTLPSADQPGDQVIGVGPVDPGLANNSSVPYESVILDYSHAYWQAVESGQVPVSMRQLVRKYFSSLENTSP